MSTQTKDQVFSANPTSEDWKTEASHDHVVDAIDNALELIAEANSVAEGKIEVTAFDISIIVPVYNERRTIADVIERIEKVMPPTTQLIIVDDGSTDGTAQWLEELPKRSNRTVLIRDENHGKGAAVRLGIQHSEGRVVAIQDADLEYDPADLLRVMWPILDGDADVVYGSRYLGDSGDSSLVHRLGNWALTSASNVMTGLNLTDMETCHKAFDGDLIRSIELCESRFGFEPEITAKIAARGQAILEVPTGYDSRGYEEGKKIGWRDGVEAIKCMWRYRNG